MAQTLTESPADRIARKKREEVLRKSSKRKEALLRSLFSHFCGAFYIVAELILDYKVDFREGK